MAPGAGLEPATNRLNSRPLYQLSYPGMGGGEVSRQGALVKGGAGPHGATCVGMRAAGRATPRGAPTRKRGPHAAPALRDYVRSMPRNTAWHRAHPMALEATVEERLTWYVAHAHHCACRPMPRDIEDLARERSFCPGGVTRACDVPPADGAPRTRGPRRPPSVVTATPRPSPMRSSSPTSMRRRRRSPSPRSSSHALPFQCST